MESDLLSPSYSRSPYPAVVCATASVALAVAMGIGRFAFTPMLPLMVRDGVLPSDGGAWLAASNYLGYLLGAISTRRIPARPTTLMAASLIGIAALTAAMGATGSFAMWALLRFAAGILSAWALVATSAWALERLVRPRAASLAGIVYAGVGLGIAFVGLFCVVAAQPGVPSDMLWRDLGMLAALAIAVPLALLARSSRTACAEAAKLPDRNVPRGSLGLVICYGIFGFGYILPATFLPALAREVADDPQIFGLAWPVFGLAAASSTLVAAWALSHANRLRVWATSHVLLAAGTVLPSLWLSPATIAVAALLVGGTFLVITMVGMQEARVLAPANPTAILGLMTAAFAVGQLAGPIVSGALSCLPASPAALDVTLQAAAFGLVSSAVYLWRLASPHRN